MIETEEEKQRRIKMRGQQLIKENIDEIGGHADYYMEAKNKIFDIMDPEKRKM
jgi:hypothetical protein